MRIVSWNVQVLGGLWYKRMRGRLRLELQNVLVGGPIDVLLLQEHHLNQRRGPSHGSILQGEWLTFWSAGIGTFGSNVGVCISVKARWKEDILQYCEIIPGCAQFVLYHLRMCSSDASMYMHRIVLQERIEL